MKEKLCFVIMGFGEKTDYQTSRKLNLDKTYNGIIKPAAEAVGYKCIRADEVIHSGVIDVPMYKYLINADVVIADISAYNPNAIYELGVRHALRPYSTIVISESKLQYPFDLNHISIKKYEHLGTGIDFEEVDRFKSELIEILISISQNPKNDSPVYTYIGNLVPPTFKQLKPDSIYEKTKEDTSTETLKEMIDNAERELENSNFIEAKELFIKAREIALNNDYILQKIVLTTYKSEYPTKLESLIEALEYIKLLNPEAANDPETLGLFGAINRRLWDETNQEDYLNKAISSYEKGFYLTKSYYNGINLAFLLNVRASSLIGNERITDYTLARRIRNQVIDLCLRYYNNEDFNKREDRYWIVATLQEAYIGIGDEDKYNKMKEIAEGLSSEEWKINTTQNQIELLRKYL